MPLPIMPVRCFRCWTGGAHVYLCGNKAHLEQAVSGAVNTLMEGSSELAADDTGWKLLQRQGRLHLELY